MKEHTNKAVFSTSEPAVFSGHELRKSMRRVSVDRREMMRFELSKESRRSGNDRRAASSVWNGRPTL